MTDPSPPQRFATTAQYLAARYAEWAAANEFQYAYTRTAPHPAATSQRGSPDVRLVLHRVHLFDGAHRGALARWGWCPGCRRNWSSYTSSTIECPPSDRRG